MAETEEAKVPIVRLPLTPDGELANDTKFRLMSPATMIIVSPPLMGKTMSMINVNKFLIADADKETDYYPHCRNYVKIVSNAKEESFVTLKSGVVIPSILFDVVAELRRVNHMEKFTRWKELLEKALPQEEKVKIFRALKKLINSMPFAVTAWDSLTSLQELNNRASLHGYNMTVSPENRKKDIRKADSYSGVKYTRPNFYGLLEFIQSASPFCIYTAHVKEKKNIIEKEASQIAPLDIALEGILPHTITSRMAAVGIFNRNENGCFLDFQKRAETDIGARPPHLANKVIKISDYQSDPNILPERYWKDVYIDLAI